MPLIARYPAQWWFMSANALIAIVLGVRLWQEYKGKPRWSGNRPTRQTRDGSFTFLQNAPSEWLKYCARIPQERQNRTSAFRPTANARYQIASFVRVSVIGTQSISRERVSPSMGWPYFLGGESGVSCLRRYFVGNIFWTIPVWRFALGATRWK